jgi:hypothetical protein
MNFPYDNKVNCWTHTLSTQYLNIEQSSCRHTPDKLNVEINVDDQVILIFVRVLAIGR